MKKLLIVLFLTLSANSFCQLAPPRQKVNLLLPPVSSNQSNVPVGPMMMLGGASFIAAGLLTPPTMVGGSTNQKKPFINQLHRFLPVVSGSVVFVIGAGVSLGSR